MSDKLDTIIERLNGIEALLKRIVPPEHGGLMWKGKRLSDISDAELVKARDWSIDGDPWDTKHFAALLSVHSEMERRGIDAAVTFR